MLDPSIPFHNLHPNAREDSPWHCLYIDTESTWRTVERDEHHRLRLWYGRHKRRHLGPGWPQLAGEEWGETAEGMADYIDRVVTTKHPLHVFFHGLSFDLGLTKLPLVLMRRGWRLGRQALASDAPWCNLQRGKRSVWVVDSFSWFRKSLQEVGDLVGVAKRPLPADDDAMEAWWGRVAADVDILEAALDQLMDWWDRERLGHWSHTGPATGWNAMRHRCVYAGDPTGRRTREQHADGTIDFQPGKVTVCTDPLVRRFEREAIYQGMREVTRVGQLPEGTYANLDLERAHLSIAATKLLPCRLLDQGESLPVDSPKIGGRFHGVIARCRVRATEQSWPVRQPSHILHPLQEFWTVLCDPEIAEARERGELLEVGRWQEYLLNHFMQPWAAWCESILNGSDTSAPPAAWLACKAWSRTVIGKWGARTSRWEAIGETEEWGWFNAPALPTAGEGAAGLAQLGHTLYDVHRDQDADDASPAVLAWVQSWVRRQLRAVIREVGSEHVIQRNTDGFLVDAQAAGMARGGWDETGLPEPATWSSVRASADSVSDSLGDVRVRVKGLYRGGWVLSPQHLQLDGERVMAGVPRGAVEGRRFEYHFLTWPTLGGQMARGFEDGYTRHWVERRMGAVPVSGWVCADGCVTPPAAVVGDGGSFRLLGAITCSHGSPPLPDGRQAAILRRLSR